MEWTVRWYVNKAEEWASRRNALENLTPGHRAYAEKQISMWNEIGWVAEIMFSNANSSHNPVWRLVI